MCISFDNVVVNLFKDGEFDIQTFVESTDADTIRVNTFFNGERGGVWLSADFFPADDPGAQFQMEL